MEDKKTNGGYLATFGNTQCAINLMGILQKEQYVSYSRKVQHLLAKQNVVFLSLRNIDNKSVYLSTILMWHKRFIGLTENLPELVKTHTRCVETALYRQSLKDLL